MLHDLQKTQEMNNMTAYIIFTRENSIQDQKAMDQYSTMTRQAPKDPNLKPLVIYGDVRSLEGSTPDGVIILQFPDREKAESWYFSEDYQKAIPWRKKAADYRAFIVDGLG